MVVVVVVVKVMIMSVLVRIVILTVVGVVVVVPIVTVTVIIVSITAHDSGGGCDGDINNEGPSTTTAVLFVGHEQGGLWFLSLAYNAAGLMHYVLYLIVLVSFICIVI